MISETGGFVNRAGQKIRGSPPLFRKCKRPFQIGAVKRRFVKPRVKISKAGSHLLMDDRPINS